ATLLAEDSRLEVEWVEVRRDPEGRARFQAEARRLGLEAAGIPLFVAGDRAVVGFSPGSSEEAVRAAVRGMEAPPAVVLPVAGALDPRRVPFALFTVLVGLADGFNPCALYVLLVLLGILSHTRSRARMILYGAVFVAASGLVYFAFMAAWLGVFAAAGLSRAVTAALGALLAGMGLLNLKDAAWLGLGPRLAVPEAAKPGLFRRMRAVAAAASLPAAVAGIAVLALLVNLVELGCTLGLPAMYTRILSLRVELGPLARHAWLALYNLAYVVPLAAVVAAFTLTARRLTLGPRGARILKGVSGALLLGFGILFLVAPDLLR
ncbi:MAG TPA: NrdH-redoxin, partial [Anaeromyxobacteraceae bacterium]|nr:NrdH-redoxin [Anaeromyxobacteraceae bacterium]